MDEILVSRSTLIFLLIDSLIITKKPVLKPIHQIEFLGLLIDMNIVPLSLTWKKLIKKTEKCKILLDHSHNIV